MIKAMILILLIPVAALAQSFVCPVPSNHINCDYGPRYPLPDTYSWHRGVDYRANIWTEVRSIERGNITNIAYQGSERAGWYIDVQGDSATWTYMHLFRDLNPLSPDNIYQADSVYLVDPSNGQNNPTNRVSIFIFWADKNNRKAYKVLSENRFSNRWIRCGGGYIMDSTGTNPYRTQGSVLQREIIAPSGESGAGPEHLHVGSTSISSAVNYNINPLYYLQHAEPNYSLILQAPVINDLIYHRTNSSENQQLNERIRVYVNSEAGTDLDRAFVYLFDSGETRVYDATHLFARIAYGGPPPGIDYDQAFPSRITESKYENRGSITQTGVDPVGDRGNDDLYFIGGLNENGFHCDSKIDTSGILESQINTAARFKDGIKSIVIRTHPIRYAFRDTFFETQQRIILDNYCPYIHSVRVSDAGVDKYYQRWETIVNPRPNGGYELAKFDTVTNEAVDITKDNVIVVTFSEEMNIANYPIIELLTPQGRHVPIPQGYWQDSANYSATITAGLIRSDENGHVKVLISGAEDAENTTMDADPKNIAYRNQTGNWVDKDNGVDKNYQFEVGTLPPVVDNTKPPNNAFGVDVGNSHKEGGAAITIAFDRPIDKSTVNSSSFLFTPPLWGSFTTSWDNDSTVALTLTDAAHDFDYNTKYQIEVCANIKDTKGIALDGDGNGKPGGSYKFWFTTRKPSFDYNIIPTVRDFKPNDTKYYNCFLANNESRDLSIRIQNTAPANYLGWFSSHQDSAVFVPANSSVSLPYFLTIGLNGKPRGSCSYSVTCRAEAWSGNQYTGAVATKAANAYYITPQSDTLSDPYGLSGPGNTPPPHPDENYSVSDPLYPWLWKVDTDSKIGIALLGYYEDMGHFLGKYNIATSLVSEDSLVVLNGNHSPIESLKVLIIPTGGLRDCGYTPYVWQRLNDFVEAGGFLLVMDQPYGNLYARLPGAPQGYGWEEDYSCSGLTTRLDVWHPAMAGQTHRVVNYATDGFFSWLPADAAVLTRRILRGGAPSIAVYPYSKGKVAVSTSYLDWGLGAGQWNEAGGALLRDLVSWGLGTSGRPTSDVATANLGAPIDLQLALRREDDDFTRQANKAVVTYQNPNRAELQRYDIALDQALAPGESTSVNIPAYNPPNDDSSRGIWLANYALYADTQLLQPGRLGAVFAVKGEMMTGDSSLPPYYLTVTTTRSSYLITDTVDFIFHVGNNSGDTLHGMIHIDWKRQTYDSIPVMIVNDSSAHIIWRWPIDSTMQTGSFTISLSDSANTGRGQLASVGYGLPVIERPKVSCGLHGMIDSNWTRGRFMELVMQASSNFVGSCSLSYRFYKGNTLWFEKGFLAVFDSTRRCLRRDTLNINSTWEKGVCEARALFCHINDTTHGSSYLGKSSYWFSLGNPQVTVGVSHSAMIDSVDTARVVVFTRPVNKTLYNTKLCYNYICHRKAYSTYTIVSDTVRYDSLRNNDTIQVLLPLGRADKHFANYEFRYKLAYGDDSIAGSYSYDGGLEIDGYFNKRQAGWGDTVGYRVIVRNNSPIHYERVPLVYVYFSCGLSELNNPYSAVWGDSSCLIDLLPGRDTSFAGQEIVTPATGDYFTKIAALMDHPRVAMSAASFLVTPPQIVCFTDDSIYDAGDTVRMAAINLGGRGGYVVIEGSVTLTDPLGRNITFPGCSFDLGPSADTLLYEYVLPPGITGRYRFNWQMRQTTGTTSVKYWRSIDFMGRGYEASVALATPKQTYSPAESVAVNAFVENHGALPLAHSLDLTISPYGYFPQDQTFYPDSQGWNVANNCPGCVNNSGQLELIGYDRCYGTAEGWSLNPSWGKGGAQVTSQTQLARRLYRTARGRMRSRDEDAKTAVAFDLASHRNELYLLAATSSGNLVFFNYPDQWSASIGLPVNGMVDHLAVSDGDFFAVSSDSQAVYRVSRSGNQLVGQWPVESPGGCVAANGRVYLSNATGGLITAFGYGGDTIATFGSGRLVLPGDLAADSLGRIYASDAAGVKVFDGDGNYLGSRGNTPVQRVAVDAKGYLYAYAADSSAVFKYDLNGALIERFSCPNPVLAAVNDTLHAASLVSGSYVSGLVYYNMGRTTGIANIIVPLGGNVKYIPRFEPQGILGSGLVGWRFKCVIPEMSNLVDLPIDSLDGFDFNRYFDCTFYATLTKPDGGVSPSLRQVDITKLELRALNPVWHDSVMVNLASPDSCSSVLNAGPMPDSGSYVLKGSMRLSPAQTLPKIDNAFFTVSGKPVVVALSKQYDVYWPGEPVPVTAVVCNRTDSSFTDVRIELHKSGAVIMDTMLPVLQGHTACTLAIFASDAQSFTLGATASAAAFGQARAYDAIAVDVPEYGCSLVVPDTADSRPFEGLFSFYNPMEREVLVIARWRCGDNVYTDTMTVPAYSQQSIKRLFSIARDDSITCTMVEPVQDRRVSHVAFGPRIEFAIDTVVTYPVGRAQVRYHMQNRGSYVTAGRMKLLLLDSAGLTVDSLDKVYTSSVGDSVADMWWTNPGIGAYTLRWGITIDSLDVPLGNGERTFGIMPANSATIDSLVLSARADSVGDPVLFLYASNRSADPFTGTLGVGSDLGFWRQDVTMDGSSSSQHRITLNGPAQPGQLPVFAYCTTAGDTISLCNRTFSLRPAIAVDSLPDTVLTSIGDTVRLPLLVRNNGNAVCRDTVRVNLGELLVTQRSLDLPPMAAWRDSVRGVVPDDLESQLIPGSVQAGPVLRPVAVRVEGYAISAGARLNQQAYRPGDSVLLTLDATNASERNVKCRRTASYLGRENTGAFLLAGLARDVDLADNRRIIGRSGDSSLYVSRLLDLGVYDSLAAQVDTSKPALQPSVRLVRDDSVTAGPWGAVVGTAGRFAQYRLRFTGRDTVERVVLSRYCGGIRSDTTFEAFDSCVVHQTAAFAFEASQGPQALLAYGVYTASGRGLYLNTAYVYSGDDSLTIVPARQVYGPSDTVRIDVRSPLQGRLVYAVALPPLSGLLDSVQLHGTDTSLQFALPQEQAASTRTLVYAFKPAGDTIAARSGQCRFDVDGYRLSVVEKRLERNGLGSGDTVAAYIKIKSSHNLGVNVINSVAWSPGAMLCPPETTTTALGTGYTWLTLRRALPAISAGGTADIAFELQHGALLLGQDRLRFTLAIADTTAPDAYFSIRPASTFECQLPYPVALARRERGPCVDTLYYHDGYNWRILAPETADTTGCCFLIPPQQRGTTLAYYAVTSDPAGNKARIPHAGFETFQILFPMPPSDCLAETTSQHVRLSWRQPAQEVAYHLFNPAEQTNDPTALRVSPAFTPASIEEITTWVPYYSPSGLRLNLYALRADGGPGGDTHAPIVLTLPDTMPGWKSWRLDTAAIVFDGDFYLGWSNPELPSYGDGNPDAYRTWLKQQDGWIADPLFGNLCTHVKLAYPAANVTYRIDRAVTDSGYVALQDSVSGLSYLDTTNAIEARYRYQVCSIWDQNALYNTSGAIPVTVDYLPPRYDDSLAIVIGDSAILIGAHIADGIGILADSLFTVQGTSRANDSIRAGRRWYSLPYTSPGDSVRFYLAAWDSALNKGREPREGWRTLVPQGVSARPDALPRCFQLNASYPNPTRGRASIGYQLPCETAVKLNLYNTLGQKVRTLVDAKSPAGYYTAHWEGRDDDGRRVAAGVYFYQLKAGQFSKIRKLVILR